MTIVVRWTAAFAILASALSASAARADEDIPAYKVLSCEKDCLPQTSAVLVDNPPPQYPPAGGGTEALVDIDYTIAADGTVKDAVVENLLGYEVFAKAALTAVGARTYKPATEAGQPVEENHRIRFLFRIPNHPKGATHDMFYHYRDAVQLSVDGKVPESIAALSALEAKPSNNLYERTMIALALAELYFDTKDYLDGREAIRVATISRGAFLGNDVIENAIRMRIRLEALNGDFAESFAWYKILDEKGLVKPNDPDGALVGRMHAKMAGAAALVSTGRISPSGMPAFAEHTLLRRSFEFQNVVGKLDRFEMHCSRHSILSPFSAKANWTVPASWSDCHINVYGAPGSTYQIVEYPAAMP